MPRSGNLKRAIVAGLDKTTVRQSFSHSRGDSFLSILCALQSIHLENTKVMQIFGFDHTKKFPFSAQSFSHSRGDSFLSILCALQSIHLENTKVMQIFGFDHTKKFPFSALQC